MENSSMRKNPGKTSGIWNDTFIHAFIINMVLHICIYMMNTLSATYADYLGATSMVVGVVAGLFAATALILKLVSAPAIDTFNRKYVLMWSIGILFIAFICYTFSYNIPMLIISRLLTGAGMAFTTTCCLTVASDSLPNEKMASGIGYFTLGTAISQAIAPYLGLNMVALIGYNKTFAVCAVVVGLIIVYTGTMKVDFVRTKKFRISLNGIIAKPAIPGAILIFLMNCAFSTINSFLVLYAIWRGVDQKSAGLYFTVYALVLLVSRPLIGTLTDKLGVVKVVVPSLCSFALSFLIISMAHSLPVLIVATFFSAFGYGGCYPAIQAVCMRSVDKEHRGAASSTAYVGSDLANLIGPIVAGAVVDAAGYVAMWRFDILPIAAAVVLMFVFRNALEMKRNKSAEETA